MEVTKVKKAAELLEQYERLGKFLSEAPNDPETFTLTLRSGRDSKSLSLKHDERFFDAIALAKGLRQNLLEEMRELGVEV